MSNDDFEMVLVSLGIGNNSFFQFLKGKIKSYPLKVQEFGWGCFPITNDKNVLVDIRVLVPKIIDEGTLLVNIHEFAHAFELFGKLGLEYIEDVERSEKYATDMEKCYLKIKNK